MRITLKSFISNDPSLANHSYRAICTPITLFLWAIGLIVYFGLPNYYRQTPGKMPSFYKSVFRRKIVLWNWVVVILQNFFLSAPYGRNWNCESLVYTEPPTTIPPFLCVGLH